jgi:serine protease Do
VTGGAEAPPPHVTSVAAGLQPRTAPGPEPRVAPGPEPRVAAGLEPRVAAGLEPRVAAGLEPRVAAGLQPRGAAPRAAALADLGSASEQLEALAERVGPAVVQVLTLGYATGDLADGERGVLVAPSRGSGSGVIVDAAGYIVTNAHVVAGAHRIQVELPVRDAAGATARSVVRPRPRLVGAQLVAVDEETDIAVLKVGERDLPALKFADSDAVRPGQIVMAFGSPLGLTSSVTLGVVSAVGRQLETEDPMVYLQTDAPINPGNSGGPLVNLAGEVVGINTLILSQSGGNEGLGFAAPSNIVRRIFEQIRQYGRVRRGEIGVRAQTITPLLAEGLKLGRDAGVVLSDVYAGGPAATAGAEVGDIVLRLDGKPMENGRQLQVNLYSRAVGETVRLDIERRGVALTLSVPVAEREDDPMRFAALARPEEHLIQRLGVLGLTLTPDLADLLPDIRVRSGVVVAGASGEQIPGSDGRLQPGDVIHAVNGSVVRNLPELRAAVEAVKRGHALVVQIERDAELQYVAVRVEN